MWSILKFIFSSLISFIQMLFTIQVDDGLSLGLLFCICFILLPMMVRIINFIKQDAIEELDDRIDESRPREVITGGFSESAKGSNGRVYHYSHTFTKRRRHRR